MRKLGWFLIIVIFVAMIWTILALAFPPVGTMSYDFFVVILGQNIVNGATGLSTAIMLWGSTGFLPAFAVFLGTGILFLTLGVLFTRIVRPHLPGRLGIKQTSTTPATAPLQSRLQEPALPPVEKKEVEATA